MPHSLLMSFEKHPRQRELIGNLILAYGELEFILQDILRAVLDDDLMTATRTLYRLRSEANRLSVADAIIRPRMDAQGILPAYLDAYGAIFACKNVRNRYAHAQYVEEKGELWVGDLDEAAKSSGATTKIRFKLVTLRHLKQEWEYFCYADHALIYAANQYRIKTGQPLPLDAVIPKPRKVQLPRIGNPPAARSPEANKRG